MFCDVAQVLRRLGWVFVNWDCVCVCVCLCLVYLWKKSWGNNIVPWKERRRRYIDNDSCRQVLLFVREFGNASPSSTPTGVFLSQPGGLRRQIKATGNCGYFGKCKCALKYLGVENSTVFSLMFLFLMFFFVLFSFWPNSLVLFERLGTKYCLLKEETTLDADSNLYKLYTPTYSRRPRTTP